MTETTLNAEEITEITEITEVVTASEALKPTEKIKKPPSQAKLDALERARLARSQKAKEKRETLLKAALIVDKAAQPKEPEPPPRTLDFYVNAHNEGLEKYPDSYKQLVTPPPEILDLPQRPVLKFV
jgi:hypothetical protein